MQGGDFENGTTVTASAEASLITDQLSTLSLNGDPKLEKDPRKIARKYQIDLCKKALEENVIVYLGTGCGKTHIAVLLIYEMGQLIKKPQKNICVFLAPTVALVQQQAKVIEDSIDFKVGTYCGNSKHLKTHHDWETEMEQYEVLVMTPQVLLHNLSHCYIRIELIALLIFDECHYAQLESDHPYSEIMKIFYKPDVVKLPRIFGMTASPISGKGATIEGLETLLRSKVYTVEDNDELEQFVASPKVNVYYYTPVINGSLSLTKAYSQKLEEIKQQCIMELHKKAVDHSTLRNMKKLLKRLHGHLIFCLENLGVLGALQASCILLKGDNYERHQMVEAEGNASDNSLCDKYLTKVDAVFTSGCAKDGMNADLALVEVLKEPYFSKKLLRLIGILSNFGVQPDMKCIIFVNRIVTARSLSYMLQYLKVLSSWKCGFLVGVHSGLKSMSRKNTNAILNKFRSGELNLLVATKVGEEGLDIQTCCLVIRFDLPETVASFIQSRGRARMPKSEYAFLVDSGNQRELNLIEHFTRNEARMNDEISSRKSCTMVADFQEKIYKVDMTGATISSASSISLLHRYCSKLPHDEFFCPKPQFYYFDDRDGTICKLILPSNAPMHEIVSAPQSSLEAAKKDACLKACKRLHELGALTDYLLPDHANEDEDLIHGFSDSESSDGEDTREELHEMIVPAALKEPWAEIGNPVCLNSYYIKFSPCPNDRVYKKFGLFLKAPLPQEAERMKLDLNLARGRSVKTELIPSGATKFDNNEIQLAEKFQRMFLKVILDRSEFISEFVSLERKDYLDSASKFYLLLPVSLLGPNKISVDWELVRRCLSSPIFGTPVYAGNNGISKLDGQLQLANGSKSIHDVVNSLVYAPCKNTFFFVSDVVKEKNAYSIYKDSKNHVEHYYDTFANNLSYPDQPLIKAKQLFCLDNLLRKRGDSELRDKEEHFVDLPPEICQLKIIGFSKDIGSSLSLLPSIMHRLESLLVAVELKGRLSASFPEGREVAIDHVLEALTTEKCHEPFSLERLEVLGDAFLKFAVGRHVFLSHDALDEGQLTRKRSNIVNNSNLHAIAIRKNLQAYIRDQSFEPNHFYVIGRPCPVICNKQTEKSIHGLCGVTDGAKTEVRCSKCHQWLRKKTIADIVEALVGAFVVDSGFKAATAFLKWIGIDTDFKESQVKDICFASKVFMPLADKIDIPAIERLLNYPFVHKGLLVQAFIHPSYNNHGGGCYQRLEFLGDAVLDYLITSYLYSVYPKLKPGQLTDLRSVSVNNNTFALVAVRQSFHSHILCDSSGLRESIAGYVNFIGRPDSMKMLAEEPSCPKALGDLVESCMGAILLDTGFDLDQAWCVMLSFLKPFMSFSQLRLNPIRQLHELCQFYGWDLKFLASKKDNKYLVEVKVNGKNVSAAPSAPNISRKAAKRMAAEQVYSSLKAQGYRPKAKSLEEVLKTAKKMEAKLIGYDEAPCVITARCDGLEEHEESESDRHFKILPISEELAKNYNFKFKPVRKLLSPEAALGCNAEQTSIHNGSNAVSKATGGSKNGSAKSLLHEICAANCWKPPRFECCKETGPSHLKEFSFRVILEIEETSRVIESCGEPRAKKKDAAEHAAAGAVWFLKQEGYLFDN